MGARACRLHVMQPRSSVLLVALALAPAVTVATGCKQTERPNGEIGMLRAGDLAPALSSEAHDGTTVSLSNTGKPTIVYFYPKDDTPGCTKEACAFRDAWDRYGDAGVLVVGVSADDNESHRAFAQKYNLPFPLVADPDLTWASAFGVPTMGNLTKRVSFLIDSDGKIAKVYPGVDPAVHADEVLRDAAELQ